MWGSTYCSALLSLYTPVFTFNPEICRISCTVTESGVGLIMCRVPQQGYADQRPLRGCWRYLLFVTIENISCPPLQPTLHLSQLCHPHSHSHSHRAHSIQGLGIVCTMSHMSHYHRCPHYAAPPANVIVVRSWAGAGAGEGKVILAPSCGRLPDY